MTITVVGTVAFDAIQTPFGKVDRCLGGSATYFSVAASFFSPVNLVAVVGDDFTDDDASIFAGRDINLDGLQRVAGAKSFFWSGEYGFDLNVAKTRATRDWRALLREQFTLTSTQKRALEVLPKKTVQQVQQAVREAIHTNAMFVVRAVGVEEVVPPAPQQGGGAPSPARTETARIAAWKKPDAVVCTRSDGTYECAVKAGVVC